jgi:hypothetical protein
VPGGGAIGIGMGGSMGGSGGAAGGGNGEAIGTPIVVPQLPQNAASGAIGAAQFGHIWTFVMVTDANEMSSVGSAVPQFLQKVEPFRLTVPHRGQLAIGSS